MTGKRSEWYKSGEKVIVWENRRSFIFNDTATTEIYTLSLHDALPISCYFQVPHSYLVRGLFSLARSFVHD